MPCIILLQSLLIADLEVAVPDSRYRHEYKDNKLSVPRQNYVQCPDKITFSAQTKLLLHEAIYFQLELG